MQADIKPYELNLGASLTVDRAAALRDEIAAALAGGESVRIGFSAVGELDLSCLQVLFAAVVSAKASGKELSFSGKLSQHVSERLKCCGFLGVQSERAEDLEAALGLLA